MKWSQISGRIWLALATFLVVGLLFAYYFLSYVPQHERILIGKKYRTMQRIAKNFSEMRAFYEGSIDLLLRKQHDKSTTDDSVEIFIARIIEAKKARNTDLVKKYRGKMRALLGNDLSQIGVEYSPPGDTAEDKRYLRIKQWYRVKITNLITNAEIIDHQFDRFLIVRVFNGKTTERKNHPPSDSTASVVAYQGRKFEAANGAESKILLADINHLFDTAQVFRTIPQHTVRISGTPYRALSYVIEMQADEDWILCGLVDESSIQADIKKIDLFAIIIMVLLALFLLLAMPVLKLLIMSSIERLQIMNVWFIGFSIVTGTMLVTILLLVSHHYVNYEDDYKAKLEKLSKSVSDKFKGEIDNILSQMNDVQQTFVKRNQPSVYLPQYEYILDTPDPMFCKNLLAYKYFNEFLVLNAKGKVPVTFANHLLPNISQELPDLSKRKYFSETNANQTLSFSNSSQGFYVQSIRSWNSGVHEAGVSLRKSFQIISKVGGESNHVVGPDDDRPKAYRIDTIAVVATATRLRSVMNTLLSPGFQFCIVDVNGDVLFHSDENKNLQENFFDEIAHDYMAKATIEGRTTQHLDVNYGGIKCLAYITPLDTQAMFLITLLDRDYYNTPVTLTVGVVSILSIIMMLTIGVQLFILFCVTYRSSKLHIRRFSLGWIGPRSDTDDQPFGIHYARCVSTMLMILPILLIICVSSSARYFALIFLTLPVLLLAAHYAVLYVADPENNSKLKRDVFVGTSVILIVIVNIAAFVNLPLKSGIWLAILQIVITTVAATNIYTDIFSSLYHWLDDKLETGTLYTSFLCCWLFLVSVLPVFYFYKTSFLHENFLWKKFIQWDAYQHTRERNRSLQNEFNDLKFTRASNDSTRSAMKADYLKMADHYGNYLSCDTDTNDTSKVVPVRGGLLEKWEFEYRPSFFSGPLESSRHVLLDGDNPVKWFAMASRENLVLRENKSVIYSSMIPSFTLMKGKYALAFAVLFILFCLSIYVLIRICVKYIYGWRLLTGSKPTLHPIDLEASLKNGSHKLFIIGLPYSGKSTLLKAFTEAHSAKEIFLRTDLDTLGDISSIEYFVIHNFEHGLNDEELNKKRLQLFVNMQKNVNAKIIVSSTVQPEAILDVLDGKIKQLVEAKKNEEKDKAGIQKEITALRSAARSWKNILAGFETQYKALTQSETNTFLDQELDIGTYLPRLKSYFKSTNDVGEREEIVLSIEERANAYYQGLWNSFTRKEKNSLFDLAKDRFVNLRDTSNIRVLIRKGIVVMRDSPQIMNRSFNDFILSVVKEDEALAMDNELRRKGSWSGIQLILVITLVSITIFISVVQQEVLSSVNALVATVTAAIAVLVKFSGLFSVGKKE
ncbi:MAG: hypothetical protein ABI477_12630 [Chryseolinea sp.]